MNNQYLLSICIPSYNRPSEIKRLLESIDTKNINEVQIVICEDKAPKRSEVRDVVSEFKKLTKYSLKYIENFENYGHGRNMRECIFQAEGEYILFMGDDDMFIPEAFDKFFDFVSDHKNIGYFLRSYAIIDKNNKIEYFKYFSSDKFFEPGLTPYIQFFGKSVSMSGFTIKRKFVKDFDIEFFDDTLLYQLYLVAEVCLNQPSAYCNIPFTYVVSDGGSFFGVNENEKGKYEIGRIVADNINFIIGRYKITEFIDKKYGINSTHLIKQDTSKYCFYILAESRKYGKSYFRKQRKFFKEAGLDSTIYFYIYYYCLFFGGINFSISIIKFIKNIVGRRLTF
ncbi:MAG: glycosyltransferase family 2 protein [Mariniphaga sp.]|nr:glycosyltransferase family 2 protein [Mariniphaga sp.]